MLWEDGFGIGAAFSPAFNRYAPSLCRGIYDRSGNGLSFTLHIHASHYEIIRGEKLEVIDHCTPKELSIVSEPKCWDARCWPATDDVRDMPPGIRNLSNYWNVFCPA
jgi:hypothetical protein